MIEKETCGYCKRKVPNNTLWKVGSRWGCFLCRKRNQDGRMWDILTKKWLI